MLCGKFAAELSYLTYILSLQKQGKGRVAKYMQCALKLCNCNQHSTDAEADILHLREANSLPYRV